MVHAGRLALQIDQAARWDFPDLYRDEIEVHWQRRLSDNPSFFNGSVMLMLSGGRVDGDTLACSFVATDFKSYLYWRDQGFADQQVRDAFGSGLVWSSDGALMLVRQSAGQVNTGLTYFPGGFIDDRDLDADGRIDIAASVSRELAEETGLSATELERVPGYVISSCGPQLSFGVQFRSALTAATLKARIMAFIAQDEKPELSDVLFMTTPQLEDGGAFAPYAEVLAEHMLAE